MSFFDDWCNSYTNNVSDNEEDDDCDDEDYQRRKRRRTDVPSLSKSQSVQTLVSSKQTPFIHSPSESFSHYRERPMAEYNNIHKHNKRTSRLSTYHNNKNSVFIRHAKNRSAFIGSPTLTTQSQYPPQARAHNHHNNNNSSRLKNRTKSSITGNGMVPNESTSNNGHQNTNTNNTDTKSNNLYHSTIREQPVPMSRHHSSAHRPRDSSHNFSQSKSIGTTILHDQNSSLWDFINCHFIFYSSTCLLNDYYHIFDQHKYVPSDFEYILEHLPITTNMRNHTNNNNNEKKSTDNINIKNNNNRCNPLTCDKLKRNERNRGGAKHANRNSIKTPRYLRNSIYRYLGFSDLKEINCIQILDRMHSALYHSTDLFLFSKSEKRDILSLSDNDNGNVNNGGNDNGSVSSEVGDTIHNSHLLFRANIDYKKCLQYLQQKQSNLREVRKHLDLDCNKFVMALNTHQVTGHHHHNNDNGTERETTPMSPLSPVSPSIEDNHNSNALGILPMSPTVSHEYQLYPIPHQRNVYANANAGMVNMSTFGYEYDYWSGGATAAASTSKSKRSSFCNGNGNGNGNDGRQLPIKIKFGNLKQELLSNSLYPISRHDWNISYEMAKNLLLTLKVKQFKSGIYDDEQMRKYKIKYGQILSIHHLITILFYCNYQKLSQALLQTFYIQQNTAAHTHTHSHHKTNSFYYNNNSPSHSASNSTSSVRMDGAVAVAVAALDPNFSFNSNSADINNNNNNTIRSINTKHRKKSSLVAVVDHVADMMRKHSELANFAKNLYEITVIFGYSMGERPRFSYFRHSTQSQHKHKHKHSGKKSKHQKSSRKTNSSLLPNALITNMRHMSLKDSYHYTPSVLYHGMPNKDAIFNDLQFQVCYHSLISVCSEYSIAHQFVNHEQGLVLALEKCEMLSGPKLFDVSWISDFEYEQEMLLVCCHNFRRKRDDQLLLLSMHSNSNGSNSSGVVDSGTALQPQSTDHTLLKLSSVFDTYFWDIDTEDRADEADVDIAEEKDDELLLDLSNANKQKQQLLYCYYYEIFAMNILSDFIHGKTISVMEETMHSSHLDQQRLMQVLNQLLTSRIQRNTSNHDRHVSSVKLKHMATNVNHYGSNFDHMFDTFCERLIQKIKINQIEINESLENNKRNHNHNSGKNNALHMNISSIGSNTGSVINDLEHQLKNIILRHFTIQLKLDAVENEDEHENDSENGSEHANARVNENGMAMLSIQTNTVSKKISVLPEILTYVNIERIIRVFANCTSIEIKSPMLHSILFENILHLIEDNNRNHTESQMNTIDETEEFVRKEFKFALRSIKLKWIHWQSQKYITNFQQISDTFAEQFEENNWSIRRIERFGFDYIHIVKHTPQQPTNNII